MKVLLVEDDENLGQGVKALLELDGFSVDWAIDGAEAIQNYKLNTQNAYDLVLLDWMLPELNGIEVCQWLRNSRKGNYSGGIIFLTAKSALDDCVKALDIGADDYITKPFEIKELQARMNAVLRRKNKPYIDEIATVKNFSLNCAENSLTFADNTVYFSKTEFKVLHILFVNNGQTILRETLFEKVWGDNLDISNASLDSYIYNLRKKLKIWADKISIRLIKNIGYVLDIKE